MDIILRSGSGQPIYEQITSQLKAQIMEGALRAGDALPSMRALAKSLHISVITAQRAYEDLQRDGFIETAVGRGTFVAAQNGEFLREERLRRIEEHLRQAAELARGCGIPAEKLQELIGLFYTEED